MAQSLGGFTGPLVCTRVPVELLVMVTAMIPLPGETGGEWWANTGHAEAVAALGLPDDSPEMLFIHDVPAEVLAAIEPPRDQSGTPMGEPWPLDAWPDVPIRFLLCRDDRFFPPDWMRAIVRPPRHRTRGDPRRPLRLRSQPEELAAHLHQCSVGGQRPRRSRAVHRGRRPASRLALAKALGGDLGPAGSLPAMDDDQGEVPVDIKPRSRDVTDGPKRAPARAMLRAIGMTDDDWDKPQVAVASSWNEVTPCNLPLDRLAKRSKEGVRAAGGFPIEFITIAVSDGISMGHEGMRASLVSREVIADSVETVMHAERFDGMVTFAGCDKSLPGMLMAAARLNLPSVFLYGGSILPGQHNGQGHRHRVRVRGRGRPRRRLDGRRRARRHRAQRLPERGELRRHVHRQHDGVGGRGHRHVAARLGVAAGPRQPAATTSPTRRARPSSTSWS